ncbi:methyltransferase domain-containing protein [Desulfovibrio aerotolerans]|uniref:Methyltransferase domain-containing protein n=1 Tax=Solidesulfovibrio aerotolerans TaxID=295255 RepID=A0A7C9MX48_9BACT|nr:class I SAM-dependent methyltransferase [Solidesulfovibrio aerotolerans]MYL85014.1 methyltransferase domain-containing protein [Solidesulfovibrio aerotolerans]
MDNTPIDKDFYRYDANHRFAAMYPLLARQIVDDCGIRTGVCLDVGTGGAPVLIELAKLTDCALIGLDAQAEVLDIARENVVRHGLPPQRFRFLKADVTEVPLAAGSVDLLISRGSIPFWPDHVAAFEELYRVLAPGGTGFIGCGFSRYQPLEEVRAMRPKWTGDGDADARNDWKKDGYLDKVLARAGVPEATVQADAYGVWVTLRKPVSSQTVAE